VGLAWRSERGGSLRLTQACLTSPFRFETLT